LIGTGTVEQLGEMVKHLGGNKVLVVTDPGVVQAGLLEKVKQPLEKEHIEFGVFDKCEPDCPVNVTQNCAQFAAAGGYDLLVGLGGGSTLDTTKLVSVAAAAEDISLENISSHVVNGPPRRGLQTILIPTTAGTGSEISAAAVLVDVDGVKKAARHEYYLAKIAIVDPLMTQYLPPAITAQTGIDALSHAFEAYLCPTPNILADTLAEMTIKLVSDNLRTAYRNGAQNLEARYNMAIAATYAMSTIFISGPTPNVSLYHAMGHSLQIEAKTTHGISLYLVMPPIMEFNLMATPERFARIAEMMGEKVEGLPLREAASKSIDAVKQLAMDIGLPQRLRDIGVKKEQIPKFVEVLFNNYAGRIKANPRPISREDAIKLYESAW
jgi:alcohol dehydrogenase class IV